MPAYVIHKIVHSAIALKNLDYQSHRSSISLHYVVFVVGSLIFLFRLVLVVALFKTRRNYGQDLKEKSQFNACWTSLDFVRIFSAISTLCLVFGSPFSFATLQTKTRDLDEQESQDFTEFQ
jgi:hypothetical protein